MYNILLRTAKIVTLYLLPLTKTGAMLIFLKDIKNFDGRKFSF